MRGPTLPDRTLAEMPFMHGRNARGAPRLARVNQRPQSARTTVASHSIAAGGWGPSGGEGRSGSARVENLPMASLPTSGRRAPFVGVEGERRGKPSLRARRRCESLRAGDSEPRDERKRPRAPVEQSLDSRGRDDPRIGWFRICRSEVSECWSLWEKRSPHNDPNRPRQRRAPWCPAERGDEQRCRGPP